MLVKTNYGDFGGFKDLETYMRLEKIKTVDIQLVDYMTIKISLPIKKYTYEDIQEILR